MHIQQDQVVLTSLEIVVSLLVFGVGVPALIYDRPQWLRRIRDDHSYWSWYPTIAAGVLFIIFVILTLYLIDTPSFLGCSAPSSIRFDLTCRFINFTRLRVNTISGLLIILATAVTLGLWARLRSYRTFYVVRKLEAIALGTSFRYQLPRWRIFRFMDTSLAEKESCIEGLGNIGRTVEIDGDRRLVLETLGKLTKGDHLFTTNDPSFPLLRSYVEAVLKTASKDDVPIQKMAIAIMETLLSRASSRNDYSIPIVSEYLTRIGRQTITFKNDELDFELWNVVQSGTTVHHALPLFNWGVLALGLGRESAAIRFITGLQAQTERIMPKDASAGLQFAHSPEIAYLFVGLAAHFCAAGGAGTGQTQQQIGRDRLATIFQGYESDMDPLFDRGIDFFTLRSDFKTVDRIVELRANLNAGQP